MNCLDINSINDDNLSVEKNGTVIFIIIIIFLNRVIVVNVFQIFSCLNIIFNCHFRKYCTI